MARYGEVESPYEVRELWRRTDMHARQLQALERRHHVGVWMNPTFLNSWSNAGLPYKDYRYRLVLEDTLQAVGTIGGGSTGTIAFILPPIWRPIDGDVIWHGSVVGSITPAQFRADYLTGEVTITF